MPFWHLPSARNRGRHGKDTAHHPSDQQSAETGMKEKASPMTYNNQALAAQSDAMPALCCGLGQFDTRKPILDDGRPNPKAGQPFGRITLPEIAAMMQAPPTAAKGRGRWLLASSYNDHDARSFKVQVEKGRYSILLVDIDEGNLPLERVRELAVGLLPGTRALIHSSASATPNNRKWHLIIPLTMEIPYEAFTVYQLALFAAFGHNGAKVDKTLARAAQLFYLPSRSTLEGYYEWDEIPGLPYQPGCGTWLCLHARDLFKAKLSEHDQVSKGHGPHSIIGWVNQSFLTEDLLERYGYSFDGKEWASPYQQASGNRHSTMVRQDGSWFSLSDSDEAAGPGRRVRNGGMNGDAFDLIKHYAFEGSEAAALDWALDARRQQEAADPRMQQLKKLVGGMLK